MKKLTTELCEMLNQNFLSKRAIRRKTKLTVHKTTYIPVITCGCDMAFVHQI